MAETIKLTKDQEWLSKVFKVDVEKVFLKDLKTDAKKKVFNDQLAGFHGRWIDYNDMLDKLTDSKEMQEAIEKETMPKKTFQESLVALKEARADILHGELFRAYLALDASIEDFDTHIIGKRFPWKWRSHKSK